MPDKQVIIKLAFFYYNVTEWLVSGHKTRRYELKGTYIERTPDQMPVFDKDGNYRMRKPKNWDESYKDGNLPEWAKGAKYF